MRLTTSPCAGSARPSGRSGTVPGLHPPVRQSFADGDTWRAAATSPGWNDGRRLAVIHCLSRRHLRDGLRRVSCRRRHCAPPWRAGRSWTWTGVFRRARLSTPLRPTHTEHCLTGVINGRVCSRTPQRYYLLFAPRLARTSASGAEVRAKFDSVLWLDRERSRVDVRPRLGRTAGLY